MTDDEKAQSMAKKMGKNASQADIDNVSKKLDSMNKGPLAAVWNKIQTMWKAFNSPSTPAYMKAIIIGGLIYVVSPLDIVPDIIPIAGLLDDVGVVGMVFSQLVKLGIAAGAAGVAYAIIKHLDLKRLKEELKKKQAEILCEKKKRVVSATILENFKNNDVNYVKSGLYDEADNLIDTVETPAEQIDGNEIYVGRKLDLTA